MEDFSTPGIGHNSMSPEEIVREGIFERHGHLKPRTDELLSKIERVPEEIPEEMAPKVTDFIKSITAHVKAINGARIAEKEPHLAASRAVDGIFKTMSEPLEAGKSKIEVRLGVVLRAKEARLRKEAEEKARIEREEAERVRREAEEAARLQREEAARLRKEAEAAARLQREEAERIRREFEESERKQAEEAARIKAEIEAAEKRREEAEVAAAESRKTRDKALREAREAEAKAKADAIEAERLLEENRKAAERAAALAERERAKQLAEAEREAKAAERSADKLDREADKAVKKQDAAVAREQRVENTKAADFSRTRGDYGAVGSLRERWVYANLDRDKLDIEKLRHFIPIDGLERAVRGFIDSGGRKCDGVDIFEDTAARVS